MRIITLNLYFKQHRQEKIDVLVDFLISARPDIIAFQETIKEELFEIKNRLDFMGEGYFLYDGWEDDEKTVQVTSGTAIIYRKGIFETADFRHVTVDVPEKVEAGMNKSYSCLSATFTINNFKLGILSTHFSVKYEDRMSEVGVLNDFISGELSGIGGLVVLGDFNNNKTGGSFNANHYFKSHGFTDVWEELYPDIKCVTYRGVDWWKKNYPHHKQTKKYIRKNESFEDDTLDFIFYRGNLEFKSISTFDLTPTVSDHLGLIADFNIN